MFIVSPISPSRRSTVSIEIWRMSMDVPEGDLAIIIHALREAEKFLELRDKMNAQIHLQSPRLSPLTELVIRATALAAKARR